MERNFTEFYTNQTKVKKYIFLLNHLYFSKFLCHIISILKLFRLAQGKLIITHNSQINKNWKRCTIQLLLLDFSTGQTVCIGSMSWPATWCVPLKHI